MILWDLVRPSITALPSGATHWGAEGGGDARRRTSSHKIPLLLGKQVEAWNRLLRLSPPDETKNPVFRLLAKRRGKDRNSPPGPIQ